MTFPTSLDSRTMSRAFLNPIPLDLVLHAEPTFTRTGGLYLFPFFYNFDWPTICVPTNNSSFSGLLNVYLPISLHCWPLFVYIPWIVAYLSHFFFYFSLPKTNSSSLSTWSSAFVFDKRNISDENPSHFSDKSDSAFTRSRSSSTSSLENQTNEAVTTLTFADTLARKLGLFSSCQQFTHPRCTRLTCWQFLRHGRFGVLVGRHQPGFRFGDRDQFGRTGRTSPYSTGYGFA